MTGAFWALAAGIFCLAIDLSHCMGKDEAQGLSPGTSQKLYMLEVTILLVLPLALALDVAGTSNLCNDLMTSLNRTRVKCGYKFDGRITWLEKSLMRLHHGAVRTNLHHYRKTYSCVQHSDRAHLRCMQGLGFAVGHTVVYSPTSKILAPML